MLCCIYRYVGGIDLSFCVGPQAPFINKNASEEEKILGKSPIVGGCIEKC